MSSQISHICQIEERMVNFPDSTKKKNRIYQKGNLEQLLKNNPLVFQQLKNAKAFFGKRMFSAIGEL